MPEYTPIAKVPIPLWQEADQVPPDLKRAFLATDSLYVLKAEDEIDRNAKYADIPVGMLVTGTEVQAIWRKEAIGWSTVWSDTGWINKPTFLSGWTALDPVYYREISGVVYWKGRVQPPETYDPGSWIPIMTVPLGFRPTSPMILPGNTIDPNPGGLRYNMGNAYFEGTYASTNGYAIPMYFSYPNS